MPLTDKQLSEELAEVGTIMFGASKCSNTDLQKQQLGKAVMEGVKYIQCDGTDEEKQICSQVGIEATPTTIIAGQGYHGAQSRDVFEAAVQAPGLIAEHLKGIGATLFGRDSCIWTVRQRAIFGRHADALNYVRCDADAAQAAQCSAAGLEGVPAWKLNGKVHMGYLRLDQLAEIAGMESVRLDEQKGGR